MRRCSDALYRYLVSAATRMPVVLESRGGLLFDHETLCCEAVKWARSAYADRPDPMRLLGAEFTLYELQRLHEAVLGVPLPKDSWRRAMEDPERGSLAYTGREKQGSFGKPALLFRRAHKVNPKKETTAKHRLVWTNDSHPTVTKARKNSQTPG